jgi:hypothetical protein
VLQCSQLAKQHAGPVQVWGVKALSEPVIDRRERIQGVLAFVTLGPKPGERAALARSSSIFAP